MTVSAELNTKNFTIMNLAKTAGVVIAPGNEVKFGADNDKFTLADDANSGIGIATETAASASTARQDIVLFGSGGVAKVIGNGTVTAGTLAISAGNGKFTNSGATPDGRTVRGKFLETSAVDGAPVMMVLI